MDRWKPLGTATWSDPHCSLPSASDAAPTPVTGQRGQKHAGHRCFLYWKWCYHCCVYLYYIMYTYIIICVYIYIYMFLCTCDIDSEGIYMNMCLCIWLWFSLCIWCVRRNRIKYTCVWMTKITHKKKRCQRPLQYTQWWRNDIWRL